MTPEVTILCVTLNSLDAVRLTISSLLAHTPEHVLIHVADNGSTDGTWEYLKGIPKIRCSCLAERVGQADTLHGTTLDWLAKEVWTPYFVTLDSDVEFFQPRWLTMMLELASAHSLAALGEYEPSKGSYRARLAPHLSLVDTKAFRDLATSFRAFVKIHDVEEAERWRQRKPDFCLDIGVMSQFPSAHFYATGALFFEQIELSGRTWGIPGRQIRSCYRHLGHMSWARETKAPQAPDIARKHRYDTEYVRERLKIYSHAPDS